jgi:hypothetical protein
VCLDLAPLSPRNLIYFLKVFSRRLAHTPVTFQGLNMSLLIVDPWFPDEFFSFGLAENLKDRSQLRISHNPLDEVIIKLFSIFAKGLFQYAIQLLLGLSVLVNPVLEDLEHIFDNILSISVPAGLPLWGEALLSIFLYSLFILRELLRHDFLAFKFRSLNILCVLIGDVGVDDSDDLIFQMNLGHLYHLVIADNCEKIINC